jgi:hypothetical protein
MTVKAMAALLEGKTFRKGTGGGVDVQLYSFFNLGARWGEWLTPHPDRLNPGMTCALCAGGWVGPRVGLEGAENLAFTEIRFPDRPARSQLL